MGEQKKAEKPPEEKEEEAPKKKEEEVEVKKTKKGKPKITKAEEQLEEYKAKEAQAAEDKKAKKLIDQYEYEKAAKKVDPFAPITVEHPPDALKKALGKLSDALYDEADTTNVVKIMQDIQEQVYKIAKGPDAEALGTILLKIAARRPDAWEELRKIAAKEGKDSWAYEAVQTIVEAVKEDPEALKFAKKYVKEQKAKGKAATSADAINYYLKDIYGRLKQSKLNNHEMMRVIGVIEHSAVDAPPLATAYKLLNVKKLEKPVTLVEEGELLLELHRRKESNVTADYLTKYALNLEDEMIEKIPDKAYQTALTVALTEAEDLDGALFLAYKRKEMKPFMEANPEIKKILDDSDSLKGFMKGLTDSDLPQAKAMLERIEAIRLNFTEPFAVRTTLLKIGGPQVAEKYEGLAGKRMAEARKLLQALQWSVIKQKLAWFGKELVVGKVLLPWGKFGKAFFGTVKHPMTSKTWRKTMAEFKNAMKPTGIVMGGAVVIAVIVGLTYYFGWMRPDKKTIKNFRKDFREVWGFEFPLSDESILFYYGTDEGKRALAQLETFYPNEETVKNILTGEFENSDALKLQILDAGGKVIKPDKFVELLESLQKAAETSDKEPEALVGEKWKEWSKKGYVVTPAENYIATFCDNLGIKKKYAKEFVKNEKVFLKMWDLIMGGKLPRSLASYYAKVAMGDLSYEEKKKKLNNVILKEPMVEGSLMDVLDQYALISGDHKDFFVELLKVYKKDSVARKNLNKFKIKPGEELYGNMFGLMMFAQGVAKGEITNKNAPRTDILSGDAKFVNSETGLIEKKHYWIWIGDSSIRKYFPGISGNEKSMSFMIKYSGLDEDGELVGMAKWFIDYAGNIKNGPKTIKFFGTMWKTLDQFYDAEKGVYKYKKIESHLNKQIETLKKPPKTSWWKKLFGKKPVSSLWYPGERAPVVKMTLPTELYPRQAIVPTGKGAEKEKEVKIPKKVKEKSKSFLAEIDVSIEEAKKKKIYKKALEKGYSEEQIKKEAHDHLLAAVYYATKEPEGKNEKDLKKTAKKELASFGIIVLESGEPYLENPTKFGSMFVKFIKSLPKV